MDIKDYLKDEIKRLNRINDLLEKKINQKEIPNGEPEQIVNNVNAMYQIAQCMLDKNNTPVANTTDAIEIKCSQMKRQ